MPVKNIFRGRSMLFENDIPDGYSPNIDEIMRNHFLSLVGIPLDYYGADEGECEFMIDEIVFKVIEDPDDGYRSHLGTIEYSDDSKGIFFRAPIAQVQIEIYSEPGEYGGQLNEGYRLIDVNDGHSWLEFGTHNYDDYYPCFVFRHIPKKS